MLATSGEGEFVLGSRSRDRRVSRTRAALLASFDRLLLSRGFDGVSVGELAADADIGRSTFYEHFQGKDELLEHSVRRVLAVFAAATATGTPSDELRATLSHMRAQREMALALLQGSARLTLLRAFARDLEAYLDALVEKSAKRPIAPVPFLATTLAHAQLGFVEAWLRADDGCDATTAARLLHSTTRAGVSAMLEAR